MVYLEYLYVILVGIFIFVNRFFKGLEIIFIFLF